jgi:hypothetical protein
MKTSIILFLMSFGCFPLQSQELPNPSTPAVQDDKTAPVFHAVTSLVLVDVIAQDPKTLLPLNKLGKEDFRLFDNGNEVPITTFDSGFHYNTRPIALWFVVICNEKNNGPNGQEASGLFFHKETLLRPALDGLDKNDRVGVVHWCDNGDARLDLPLTDDRDAAISALGEQLKPFDFDTPPPSERRLGEQTMQRMTRLVIEDAHKRNPQPLPVLFYLHSDYTGIPAPEFNRLMDELLETSGIVFGLKDADVRDFIAVPPAAAGNSGHVLSAIHYMAVATGGQYFSVHPKLYATALESVLLQLHFRYELGFKPPLLDGKRHKLKVEFSDSGKKLYKNIQLRYRPEYIPNANE